MNKYQATDRMSELIARDFRLLQMMSRFGIALGFGDKTVQEVCIGNQVDTTTFLAIANFMQEEDEQITDRADELSIISLLGYLQRAHTYFLDFCLPAIREKLTVAADTPQAGEAYQLVLRFFDDYAQEVFQHMQFEDLHAFTYVRCLLEGRTDEAENIAHQACTMRSLATHPTRHHTPTNVYHTGEHSHILLLNRQQALQHKVIESKLAELKNIIIKYYPSTPNNHLLNAVLFDIFTCEEDLKLHVSIEDCLFIPAVRRLEKRLGL